jgi:hypothetical protein
MPPPKDETEDQKAIRLAKAKKQAAKSREEKMVEKYKDKVLEKEKKKQVKDESEDDDEDEEAPLKPLKPVKPIKEEEVKEEEEKPKPKPKPKAKPKAKVIIEQSSDDEDTFEASKDVIFVKRVRAKPKVEQQHAPQTDNRSASTPMPPSVATNPVTRQEQPLPQRFQQQQQQQQQQAPPPKPQMSQEKRLEMERYLNMTRGNFLPISRPR